MTSTAVLLMALMAQVGEPAEAPETEGGPESPPSAGKDGEDASAVGEVKVVALSPEDRLREFMAPPADGALEGRPITLQQALQGVSGKAAQLRVIEAYWRLSSAVAWYHLRRRVSQMSADTPQQAQVKQLMTARDEAETLEARAEAIRRQTQLVQAMGTAPSEVPLPTSMPYVGRYRTRYQQLFAGRQNVEAQQLDRLLPIRLSVIQRRGELLDYAWSALEQGFFAEQLVLDDSKQFLESVLQYNLEIAEYALLVAQPTDTPAQLVPMLIKVDPDELTNDPGDPSAAVSGERGPEVSPDVRQAAVDDRRGSSPAEHSVLVRSDDEQPLVPVRPATEAQDDGFRARSAQPE